MRFYQKIIIFLLIGVTAFSLTVSLAQADTIIERMQNTIDGIDLPSAGESDADIERNTQTIVGQVINAFLGLFGVIFMILIIYGGYRWMMAAGREEELSKGKSIIRSAVIGLIIVLTAYSISYFVASALQTATR